MVRKFIIGIFFILLPAFAAFSEVDLDASLSGLLTLSKDGGGSFTSSGLAKGDITIKSNGTKNVKSQLTLDFLSMRNLSTLGIKKAWIKFRYPKVRVTLGKNRITWGEGAAFNAGDVIFDDYISPESSDVEAFDLTADELKSINRTMVLLSFPIGKFSFAEGIYLPYDFFTTTELTTAATTSTVPDDKGLDQHSYGGRLVTKASGIKIETGYIYNGAESLHKPYVSFNGTLLLDYHLSSSVNILHGESDSDLWKNSFKISGGLFYLFELEGEEDRTLTLRLESMFKPFGVWESSEDSTKQKEYGVLLYPEVSFVPNDEISLFLRSIVSPVDISSKSTLGLNWKTYQGFSIGTFLSFNLGDDGDVYSSGSDDSLSLTISVTHKF